MGKALSGRNMFVGIAPQIAYNTAGTLFTYFQPLDISGMLEEYESQKSEKRAGTRFKGLGRKTNKKVPFSFSIEVDPETIGILLALALGKEKPVTELDDGVYEHTFTIAETLPYFTLVAYSAGVADHADDDAAHQILNCKIGKMTITGDVAGVVKLSVEGEGTQRNPVPKPVPVFSTETPFFMKAEEGTGLVEIGESIATLHAFDETTSFECSISNGISADRRIDDTNAASGIREGDSELTGKFTSIFNNETFAEIEAFQTGAIRAIRITAHAAQEFEPGYMKSLAIAIDRAKYTGSATSFDPDLISTELPFDIEPSPLFAIRVINAESEAYLASGPITP
jgi:hypothetical protein